MYKMTLLFGCIVLTILCAPCLADFIIVDWAGGGDCTTIQEAIDLAPDGFVVYVTDGTYTGDGNRDIDFGGKAITVRSINGPENCIIDCEGSHRGFYFHSGEGADSVVKGFTITNGYDGERGAGIYCSGMMIPTSPTIEDCVISGNTSDWGAGIAVDEYGTPIIDNCQVTDNTGIGIFTLHNTGTSVIDSTISRNTGGGILCSEGSITIDSCVLMENTASYYGGAISLEFSSDSVIQNSIISGNTTSADGGAISCNIGGACTVTVTNCTIAGNIAANYGGAIRTEAGLPLSS